MGNVECCAQAGGVCPDSGSPVDEAIRPIKAQPAMSSESGAEAPPEPSISTTASSSFSFDPSPKEIRANQDISGSVMIWTLQIDRSAFPDKWLGMTVDPMDEKQLIVQILKPSGLMDDWNMKQSDANLRLRFGDRIVEVNGVRDDVKAMLIECQKMDVLHFTVERDVPAILSG